ncbi:YveK family protein [Bacillus sp. 03113]|uniref:YveK family protein n=1 Tax=Bacillus sp. 03113 TaxID=2578211 RepID=UPI001141FC8D|nr:Wzz/FepE/Etk N-terminal domain-containing protein [Bacillus sp. 03113]
MEETISLKELLLILRKRLILIISIAVLAVLASGIVSFYFLTPIYQSSTQILVNQAKDQQTAYAFNEVQTNIQLVNTYNVILKSPVILDKVKEELNLSMSLSTLNSKITVGSEKDSQVMNLSVTDPDAQLAADIANKTAEVFKREIGSIMKVDNVTILTTATVAENPAPIKPNKTLNMAIALVVGLMAGVGIAFLLEYLDNTITSEEDIEKVLGLPVLGAVTEINEGKVHSQRLKEKRNLRGEMSGIR